MRLHSVAFRPFLSAMGFLVREWTENVKPGSNGFAWDTGAIMCRRVH